MVDFKYAELLPMGKDDTAYRLLSSDHVSTAEFEGKTILKIDPAGLELLAEAAFKDVSHLLRPVHLAQLEKILEDPDSSENDRYVALEMLKNAVISAEMAFPMCQDTGTGIVMGKKGQQVWTGANDARALSKGVFNAYTKLNLRYSQNAPLTMYDEKNTACNLPAQIELYATDGDAYTFLMMAKGGGSANKTYLLPGDQSGIESGNVGGVHGGQNENTGHRRLPALPSGILCGRHLCRDEPQDGEAGLGQIPRRPARQRSRGRTRLQGSGPRERTVLQRSRDNWASAPSSAASISATTSAWCACRATARQLPHRHRGQLQCRPQHQSQDHLPMAFSSSSWKLTRPGTYPSRKCRGRGGGHRSQPAHGRHPRHAHPLPGRHTPAYQRGHHRRAGISPMPNSRSDWTAVKGLPQYLSRTTSSTTPVPAKTPVGICIRLFRSHDGRPHGSVTCPYFRPRVHRMVMLAKG
jgi:hypothetical protein